MFLLLHGIPGWRGTWHRVGAKLGETARVIAPDLLGFGESGDPRADLHAEGHARALLELLDLRRVASVHLAGFDFGGPVAVTMHRLAPQRVSSLTLLATNVFTDTPIPFPLGIASVPYLGELAFRLMMGRIGLSMMWVPATRDRRAFPWRLYRKAITERGAYWTRRVFLTSLRHLETLYRPIQDSLGAVSVPTAVIWGDSDPFFPAAIGRRTAAALSGARYVELAGCGHFVPEERPAEVASQLARMIADPGVAGQGVGARLEAIVSR